jgi:peptide/nickel transport system substrate-binding protein
MKLIGSIWRRARTAVIAAAVAFGGTGATSAVHAQSTLRIVMHADLRIIDPVIASAQIARTHGYLVYDTLFALDADLVPRPQMVESHEVSPDGLTYDFTLREGLAWHDGTPVTAEDCIASLKRWGARDPMGQRLVTNTGELSAIDERTIRLVLKRPYGLVLESLAKPGGQAPFMMPKRIAETPPNTPVKDATGSGPFIFKADDWRPGDRVVYVRNPAYRPRPEPPSAFAGGKVAKIDRIEWVSIADPQTALNALQAGDVDGIESVSHDLLPLIEKDKALTVVRGRYASQYSLRPNWLHPPFDNPKLREALGYALEQEPFLQAGIGDPRYFKTCTTLFICGTRLASESGTAGRLKGDINRARELVKAANYDGTPVVLPQPTDLPVLGKPAPVIKAQLEAAGFKVELISMGWQSMVGRMNSRDLPAQGGWSVLATSWGAVDVADPITSAFLSGACERAMVGWPCDEQLETLRASFAREADPAKRKPIAAAIQARALEVGTHYPLGEWYTAAAFSTKVKGWVQAPSAAVFWNVEKAAR